MNFFQLSGHSNEPIPYYIHFIFCVISTPSTSTCWFTSGLIYVLSWRVSTYTPFVSHSCHTVQITNFEHKGTAGFHQHISLYNSSQAFMSVGEITFHLFVLMIHTATKYMVKFTTRQALRNLTHKQGKRSSQLICKTGDSTTTRSHCSYNEKTRRICITFTPVIGLLFHT